MTVKINLVLCYISSREINVWGIYFKKPKGAKCKVKELNVHQLVFWIKKCMTHSFFYHTSCSWFTHLVLP